MTAVVMVWKTNAFGSLRVKVLSHSINGDLAYVSFTRVEKYRPETLPAEMWVRTETLHKATMQLEKSDPVAAAKRTAETRRGKTPTPSVEETPTKPRTRRSPRPAAPTFSNAETF